MILQSLFSPPKPSVLPVSGPRTYHFANVIFHVTVFVAAEDDLASGRHRAPQRRVGARAPGTRLVRSWGGADHPVTATAAGGFEYAGKRYRTLTAVALAITGQHMSGPRFFGLAVSKESRA